MSWADDTEMTYTFIQQLVELLGTKRMMDTQLASSYSIKHAKSVNKVLSEISDGPSPMTLTQFLQSHPQYFHVLGNVVTAIGTPVHHQEQGPMKYADVSRGLQTIFKETKEPMSMQQLEEVFEQKFGQTITSVLQNSQKADEKPMTFDEYLQNKKNIFEVDEDTGKVYLQQALLAGPPIADPNVVKDEAFVVHEFEQLIEDAGPVCYISTLCGKFIQRNGIAVTGIIGSRPLDLFKRHPDKFMLCGGGNVTLKKFHDKGEVRDLLDQQGAAKASRMTKAAEDNQAFHPPEEISEQHIVEEFRRLIDADATKTVYISSLCGRFLQRFKKPVTAIIDERPADFLRKFPDIFVMTGGGHVGLRDVLGPDAESVPAAPREPRKEMDGGKPNGTSLPPPEREKVQRLVLTDEMLTEVHGKIAHWDIYHAAVREVKKLCEVLEANSFLAVQEVVMGGAVGKGVVSKDTCSATVALFVKQLPFSDHPKWLPHIMETLHAVLEITLKGKATQLKVESGVLQLKLPPNLAVTVSLSPIYKNHEHLLECIRNTAPAARGMFQWSFVREHVDFVGGQSQETKQTIRLITWWAAQQKWSSAFTTPDQYLLELVVIHAAEQLKSQRPGPTEMVEHILEVLANFDSIKVLWADAGLAMYTLKDIWKPLLSHEPLFDPVNPYVNLVDANGFDCRELVSFASAPDRLEPFQREAAQLPFVAAQLR
jgi:hypothetical protein